MISVFRWSLWGRTLWLGLLAAAISLLSSCSEIAYYKQSISGHLEIVSKKQPVVELLEDPNISPELRERLELADSILEFARNKLALEGEGSYRDYVDIDRPYVVWNVVATPRLSLAPQTWCFPVAGCVPYRGYFKEEGARNLAAQLQSDQNLDTYVYGVTAYSTLGWFDDPLLNTFIFETETHLVELLLHELAHQKLYIEDDSDLNEAFAVVVASKGVEMWLKQQARTELLADLEVARGRESQFYDLFDATRNELSELYASQRTDEEKLILKAQVFEKFKNHYRDLLNSWQIKPEGGWLVGELNNARFASVTTYRRLVPALEKLWDAAAQNPASFYERIKQIAELERQARHQLLLKKEVD